MDIKATDLQHIEAYLLGWGAPPVAELLPLIRNAGQGQEPLERAALAFARHKKALPISPDPKTNHALVNLLLGASPDLVARQVTLGASGLAAIFFHTDNMIDKNSLVSVIDSLVVQLRKESFPRDPKALWTFLEQRCLVSAQAGALTTIGDVTHAVLTGKTVLTVEGLDKAVALATQGWDHRHPEEPSAEPVVRGPKEGFVETAAINLVLVRRRLLDERLRVENFTVGTRSGTNVFLVYLAELALPELIDEVRTRLNRVNVDSIQESGMLEELIEDTAFTPFPLMKATERPDVVAAELLEGKFALVVDGTPHALVAPSTFVGGMQASEDYYQRWPMASFIRFLRYLFLISALTGPSVYIAMTTFHQEMLPTDLLLSLAAAREGVPFPAAVEAFLMEFSFEALREAGVRLPKPVGQTVSIVGALVIGEAAVRARMVSPVMVIVVAITGISSFVIPNFSTALSIRLLRFGMMLLAAIFGFYGILLGLIVISVHLASLRSFGIPYMSPSMPPSLSDFKDLLIRAPWWAMRKRPTYMPLHDPVRQKRGQRPQPPSAPKGGT